MVASMHGHVDIVNILIREKSDVNIRDVVSIFVLIACGVTFSDLCCPLCLQNMWNALMKAADKGNTDVVRILLENEADVLAHDNVSASPPIVPFTFYLTCALFSLHCRMASHH